MEKEIAVETWQDEEGYFIGKAVDYRGVIAFAKTEEEMLIRLARAWFAITVARSTKIATRGRSESLPKERAQKNNLRLQLAA